MCVLHAKLGDDPVSAWNLTENQQSKERGLYISVVYVIFICFALQL